MYPIATTLHTPHAPAHLLWFQANINLLSVSIDLLRLAFKLCYDGPRAVNFFPLPKQDPSEDQPMHHTRASGNGKYSQSLVSFGNCLKTTFSGGSFSLLTVSPHVHRAQYSDRLKGALPLILTCPLSLSLPHSMSPLHILPYKSHLLQPPWFPFSVSSPQDTAGPWVPLPDLQP